jgi:hypothetical protein
MCRYGPFAHPARGKYGNPRRSPRVGEPTWGCRCRRREALVELQIRGAPGVQRVRTGDPSWPTPVQRDVAVQRICRGYGSSLSAVRLLSIRGEANMGTRAQAEQG